MIHFQDNSYLTWNRNLVLILLFTWICRLDLSLGFVTWICLNLNWLLAVTGVMHEADDAYSIRSTWSCYWLDQFLTLALNILILSIIYISMDLSTNYFAHFSGCWASFVCSCHSILECCVTFSGVKFVLFIYLTFVNFLSSSSNSIRLSMRFIGWVLRRLRSFVPANNYYLLTGCKGRTRKYKPKVFHTARACEGCLENQGLVFPGMARAPS